MLKAIFFDMDDTLIENQSIYAAAAQKLYDFLADYGVKKEEAAAVFDATDKELFKTYGYSASRYPASFEKTLQHFIPEADAESVKTVRGFAEAVFTTVAPVKPGVAAALEELAKTGIPLYIVTAGPDDVQNFRLSHLPFRDKFKGAFIVPKKDPAVFETVLGKLGLKPDEAMMIGDSLKSDVIPAVAAGMEAVWIKVEASSPHELAAEGLPAQRAYAFTSLLKAAHHISKHGTPDTKACAHKKHGGPRP